MQLPLALLQSLLVMLLLLSANLPFSSGEARADAASGPFFLMGSGKLHLKNLRNGRETRVQLLKPDGSLDETAMRLIAHVHGKYRAMGPEIGFFGFSVAGEEALRRRAPYLFADGRPKADAPAGAGEKTRRRLSEGNTADRPAANSDAR